MSKSDQGILVDVLVAVEEEAGPDALDVLVKGLKADVNIGVALVYVPR